VNKAFPDMDVLTKYDHIEPIYLPHGVITNIYLRSAYYLCKHALLNRFPRKLVLLSTLILFL
jgi:hypothetical protein